MIDKPLVRDDNYFRYLSNEPPASIPAGTVMPLEFKTTTEIMAERKAWRDSTKVCECCEGRGRVPKDGDAP